MATIKYINIGGVKHEIKATYDANGQKIDEAYVKNEVLDNYSKKQDVADEVTEQLKTIVGEAPEALDTLKELSAALGDNPNFAASMTEQFTKVNESIEEEISAREASDLELQNKFSNYVEKSELDDYYVGGYIDETYAKKTEIPTDYATKDEISTNFYTKEEVDNKLDSIEVGGVDLTGYATKEDIKNQVTYTETSYQGNPKKVITLDNADLIMGKVNPDTIPEEFTEAYGDVSTLTLLQLSAWNLVDVGSPYTTVNLNSSQLLTPTIQFSGAGTHPIAYLPEGATSGLIDLEPIRTSIEELQNKSVDLTGYATESWVQEQNYLTEHQDISNLATKDEIANQVTWYATNYEGDDKKVVMFDNMELLMAKTNPNEIPEGMSDPGSVTLLQLNKWNIVDVGSPKTIVNLNTLPGYRPTVQEAGQSGEQAYQIAYTSDIEGLQATISTHTAEIAELQSDVAENLLDAKSYADKAIADLVGTAPETLNTLQEIAAELEDQDSAVATITTKLGELESKTEGLATEEWVEDQGYVKETNLTVYVTKSELEKKGYVTQLSLDAKVDQTVYDLDKENYITTDNLSTKVDELISNNYLTKTDAQEQYQAKGNYITEIPSEYITETELSAKGYLTEVPDTYATVEYVDSKYDTTLRTEFETYKTSNDTAISGINTVLENKLDSTAIEGYATQNWVQSEFQPIGNYMQNGSNISLTGYTSTTYTAIAATDSVNIALAKLENLINSYKTIVDTQSTTITTLQSQVITLQNKVADLENGSDNTGGGEESGGTLSATNMYWGALNPGEELSLEKVSSSFYSKDVSSVSADGETLTLRSVSHSMDGSRLYILTPQNIEVDTINLNGLPVMYTQQQTVIDGITFNMFEGNEMASGAKDTITVVAYGS